MTNIEDPRNMIWERTPDGVRIVKYVGEPGSSSHRVLFEHSYTSAQFAKIAREMAKAYTPPPDPLPFDADVDGKEDAADADDS